MITAAPQAGNAGVTTSSVSPAQLPEDFDPMAAAIEADNAMEQPEQKPETTPETAKPGAEGTQEATKPGTQPKPQPGEKGAEPQLTKEQKEQQRQENLLKGFQREKEAFRAEKQQILAQMQAMQRELSQFKQQRSAEPVKDQHGLTADTYEALAKKRRAEGDDEMADAAQQRADQLRRQESAARTSQPAANQQPAHTTPEFQTEWQRHTAELIADEPDLGNPESPLVKAANTLLQDKSWAPYFLSRPDGIRAAVEVAKLVQKSAEIDAAREELKTAKAEVERLTKLTQPRGSHPSGQPNNTPKRPEEMTEDDVLAFAREADRGG